MRIALFCTSREWHRYFRTGFTLTREKMLPIDVDYFESESCFWQAVQETRYELIIICSPLHYRISWGLFLSSMERLWQGRIKNHSCLVWDFDGRMIALQEEEIYYLFSVQKEVSVYDKDQSYRIGTNMKQEEERLPSASFFRIHRNCLVNLTHVKQMRGDFLVLRNGATLSVSSRRKKQVKERLLLFWGKDDEKKGQKEEGRREPGALEEKEKENRKKENKGKKEGKIKEVVKGRR